jgi:GDP-L-fucose synthase
MYFGASCVYPKETPQPIKEEYLLTGPLEPTSQPYSIAKIAGIHLCQTYHAQYGLNAVPIVPATIYGPGSDTNLEKAHVMGALIAKFHSAVVKGEKDVTVWGSGRPRREFLFAEDFVEACVFLMDHYNDAELLNVGFGSDIAIAELAEMIKKTVGFKGNIIFDKTKPDGSMAKLLDSSRMAKLGWKPKVSLEEGIAKTYNWYKNSLKS